jgi:hypothetical protein
MNLLAAADLHGAQHRLNMVLDNVARYHPDLVVVCGDITQFGPPEVATHFLNQIPCNTLAIPGNCDPPEVSSAIEQSKAVNIDRKRIQQQNTTFVGVGGDFPGSLSTLMISDKSKNVSITDVVDKTTVLVTHVPPFKTLDKPYVGYHLGSRELRSLVESHHPRLVLCAHVHENPGKTTLKDTIVVNCSLGKRTEGALIELNDTTKVHILE